MVRRRGLAVRLVYLASIKAQDHLPSYFHLHTIELA